MFRGNYSQKIFSFFLLLSVSFWSLSLNFALRPEIARAAMTDVPVTPSGGSTGGQLEAGNTTKVGLNQTEKELSIIEAASIAALNSAMQVLTKKFNDTLEQKLGIKNFLLYQEALVNAKYLIDAYQGSFIWGTVPDECYSTYANGYDRSTCFAKALSNLPLVKNFTPQQSTQLAVSRRQQQGTSGADTAQFFTDLQKLAVGASTYFTSASSCQKFDSKAVQNAAAYLAGDAAGITISQVDPASGVKFYEDMLKLGSPFADPNFQILNFQDVALQNEAKAKQAAALEIASPGLKATQEIGPDGQARIKTTSSLVSIGQQNANNALFNIAMQGYKSKYDTSSFRNFIVSLATEKLTNYIFVKLSKYIPGGADSFFTKVFGVTDLQKFKQQAEAAGRGIARQVVKNFAVTLYDKVSQMIFQGEILNESAGCGKSIQTANFTSADTTFQEPTNISIPAYGDTGNSGLAGGSGIIFQVPASIVLGQQATLSWDAGALGSNLAVTLNGGSFNNEPVGISDTRTDSPATTTTYILRVTGPNNLNVSESRTMVVNAAGTTSTRFQFDVQPRDIDPGGVVTVTWNAAAIPNGIVTITPFSDTEGVLPISGTRTHAINADTTFIMSVIDPATATTETSAITVTIIEPPVDTGDRGSGGVGGAFTRAPSATQFNVRE